MVRTFDGTSFIVYRRSALPTNHLFLYLRFITDTLNGLLVLRRQDERSAPLVSVTLANGYLRLYARNGIAEVDLIGDQIKVITLSRTFYIDTAFGCHSQAYVTLDLSR